MAGEILVDGNRATVVLGLRGNLRLLCRLRNVLGVIDLHAGRGRSGTSLAKPIPTNRALLDCRARNIIRVPHSYCRSTTSISNRCTRLAYISNRLRTARGARRVIVVHCDITRVRRYQVEGHRALRGRRPLVRPHLVAAATIVGLRRIRITRRIGRHVRVTVAGTTILLGHRRSVRTRHVRLTILLRRSGAHHLCRRLGARGVLEYLDRTGCLLLKRLRASRTKALSRLVNIELVRPVLTNLTRVLGRRANKVLARHNRLLVRQLRIIGSAQVIRTTNILNHRLINLQLLKAAVAGRRESSLDTRRDANRLERTLT